MGDIFDDSGKKIGKKQGEEIYINDKIVGKVRGQEILDTDGNIIGVMKGDKIVDRYGDELFDLKDNSIWEEHGSQATAKAENKDSLSGAACYSILKKNKKL